MKMISAWFEPRQQESAVPEIPAARLDRLQQSFRHRLTDAVEEVFHRACAENDARTAAGLYAVLEDMHLRLQQAAGPDRRLPEDALVNAREELDRCRELVRQRRQEAPEPHNA